VLELVRAAAESEHRIEQINTTPVLRLRNRLLPLLHLHELLNLPKSERADTEVFVVVTQVGAFTFGIIVDQVFDTEEIVVKPVAPILKHLSCYSGNTILGDGSVIMILDPNGLAAATTSTQLDTEQNDVMEERAKAVDNERESMLIFRAGSESPKAVPLSLVARLEDIGVETIEFSEGKPMVQYRGKLMPLVTIDAGAPLRTVGRQAVLVFADGDKSMGLVVDEILDIVDSELTIEITSDEKGRIGTAVIAGKVTEIIDVGFYLKQAFKDYLQSRTNEIQARENNPRVLIVDDSSFFRNMLRPLLVAAGYEVTTASDAEQALKLRESGMEFDLIVSDIEMPGLSGFEFAEEVRSGGRWSQARLVALSSLATADAFERGRGVGFDDYVAKHDREQLLNVLGEQLKHIRAA
jgi:two-component system, chemotaxis family, sensor kinase CheA